MTTDKPIAALFVKTGGLYFGLPCVDTWDEKRDARRYEGNAPVVAHPPRLHHSNAMCFGELVLEAVSNNDD